MKEKLTVIIPFYNEAENMASLAGGPSSHFSGKPYAAEVIFVNDGSTDNSVELLKSAPHKNYSCKIISLSRNHGSHAALRAGIFHATGNYIGFLYADLQDPPSLIDRMYEEAKKGKDIVWAHRSASGTGLADRTFSGMYAALMKRYAMKNYPSKGFDVVLFSSKVQEQLNRNIEANSSIFLQILTLGFSQSSISYEKQQRKLGRSKWTFAKKMKLLVDSFVAFSYAPIRFVTLVGFAFFFIGLGWSVYLVIRKLTLDDLDPGWPALMSVLLLGFGITNISMGIIAEYLWRTLDASRKRPVFIIDEIIELKENE